MDWMEPTQRLDSTDSDSQSANDQSVVDEKKVFGKLCLQDGSTNEFNIYKGDNLVGRDPSKCQILLSSASLSRIHAVIEGQKVKNSSVLYLSQKKALGVIPRVLLRFFFQTNVFFLCA